MEYGIYSWKIRVFLPPWANLVQKTQIYLFKMKFVTKTSSNVVNWMVTFVFTVLDRKYTFWANFVKKSRCTHSNSSILNSMATFVFPVLDGKYPSWANLIHKLKVVCLRWNLFPRLIRICWIRWWCSLFMILTENTLLWANLAQNFKSVFWKIKER